MNNEQEIIDLLQDISDYMMDNDLECGKRGSEIYHRVHELLAKMGVDESEFQ
jgi:hypothetical protein